jgi:hypothetical protein
MTMRSPKMLFAGLAVAVMFPATAFGQACLGFPSYDNRIHLAGGGQFPDSMSAYAASIGFGTAGAAFADIGASRVTLTGTKGAINAAFAEIGYQFDSKVLQVCPILGGSYSTYTKELAEQLFPGADISSQAATGGLAFGIPLSLGGPIRLVPNAAVKWEMLWTKTDAGAGGSVTDKFSSGLIDLGVGIVFFDRISIVPTYSIPFSSDDDEKVLGIFAALSFGKQRSR